MQRKEFEQGFVSNIMACRKTSLEYEHWIGNSGISFLKSLGMDKKYFVLDFGCRRGIYTIPAAMVVGDEGRVYAVDKDRTALDTLMKTADELGLDNRFTQMRNWSIVPNDSYQLQLLP